LLEKSKGKIKGKKYLQSEVIDEEDSDYEEDS